MWTWLVGAVLGAPAFADDPTLTTFEMVGGADLPASTIEVICPNGYRVRQTASHRFRFEGMPAGVCTATVTGATRARFRPVLVGEHYECMASANGFYCNAYRERAVPPPPAPTVPLPVVERTDSPGDNGNVRVMLSQPDLALWGLVVCPSGASIKASFDGSVATFEGVPDEDCMLALKGGSPVRFAGVRPGDNIVCAPAGATTRCRDSEPTSVQATARPKPRPPAPAPPPKPAVEAGTLMVRLADPSASTWVMVQCPSGFRERGAFSGGLAKVEGLPDEACSLSFKGGAPARYNGVRGGQHLTCSLEGPIARCE
jgi:hypothetical protein